MASQKTHPVDVLWEASARNWLKAELERQGVTYARLAALEIVETGPNLRNKISRGGFTAAFFLQCLAAIGTTDLRL